MCFEQFADEGLDLAERFASLIRLDQRLVVDLGDGLLFDDLDERGSRMLSQLRIHRSEHGERGHDNLDGRQGEQRAAAHGVVRHEDRHLRLVRVQRRGDLRGRQDESTWRVQDHVDGDVRIGQLNGPQHGLGVFDVDVTRDGTPEERHRLLAVDEPGHTALAAFLQATKCSRASVC
jgi:hypothetical protein